MFWWLADMGKRASQTSATTTILKLLGLRLQVQQLSFGAWHPASDELQGNCRDDAVTQTLFGLLKVERLHGQRFGSIRQSKSEVVALP